MQDFLYTSQDTKNFDSMAIKKFVKDGYDLMQTAGKGCFTKIFKLWPRIQKFVIFVGIGNNGGDGYVIAKIAAKHNLSVDVVQVGDIKKISDTANQAYQDLLKKAPKNINFIKLKDFEDYNDNDLVIVDALLGTGIKDKPKGDFEKAILLINKLKENNKAHKVFSVDIPSGLNADTGYVIDNVAVKADATLTLICLKQGLFTGCAKEYSGNVFFYDLEVGLKLQGKITPKAYLLTENNLNKFVKLKKREQYKSKHDFGHVVILGGDYGMGGAALMAGMSALRAGAGLVTVATHPSNAELLFLNQPELMSFGVDFNLFSEHFSDNDASFESEDRLAALLDSADVIVLGPGLGQGAFGKRLWGFIKNYKARPMVLDADALNWLANDPEKNDIKRDNWVLTPHPGEASRLLNTDSASIQKDRYLAVSEINKQYNGVCVLKGSGTIIAKSSEVDNNISKFVCSYGNSGMGSPGMGDVLSGVIGALIANGLALDKAALVAVLAHAKAGDNQALEHGEKGMLATDLLNEIRKFMNQHSE